MRAEWLELDQRIATFDNEFAARARTDAGARRQSPAVVCPALRRGAAAAGPDGCPRAGPHRSLGFVDPGYVSGYCSSSARPLTPSRLFLSQASLERDGWSMLWALGGRHPPLPSGPR